MQWTPMSAEQPLQGRGSALDYFGVRPSCGCVTAWMTAVSTEDEIAEFAQNMRTSGRDVIRGTREQYMDRLDTCPHVCRMCFGTGWCCADQPDPHRCRCGAVPMAEEA